MRSLLTLALVTAAIAFTGNPAHAADPPSVTAYSLNITRPPKGISDTFFVSPYTSIGLIAVLPERSIIGLNTPACKLTFTDDRGTDLTNDGKVTGLYPGVYVDTKTRTQAQVFIGVGKVPAPTASKLKVKGNLAFLCGTGEKTASAEGFPIKDKEKKTVGPITLEVMTLGNTNFVQMTADEPVVKSITVLDKDGKPAGTAGVYVALGKDNKVVQNGSYYPLPNIQAVDIKVIYYEKVESVTVPVEAEIGVGG